MLEREFSERLASFQNERAGGGRTNSQHNHGPCHPSRSTKTKKRSYTFACRLTRHSERLLTIKNEYPSPQTPYLSFTILSHGMNQINNLQRLCTVMTPPFIANSADSSVGRAVDCRGAIRRNNCNPSVPGSIPGQRNLVAFLFGLLHIAFSINMTSCTAAF